MLFLAHACFPDVVCCGMRQGLCLLDNSTPLDSDLKLSLRWILGELCIKVVSLGYESDGLLIRTFVINILHVYFIQAYVVKHRLGPITGSGCKYQEMVLEVSHGVFVNLLRSHMCRRSLFRWAPWLKDKALTERLKTHSLSPLPGFSYKSIFMHILGWKYITYIYRCEMLTVQIWWGL